MKKLIFLICLLISSLLLHAGDYPKSVQKRIDKTLVKLFPKMIVELQEMDLSTELISTYTSVKGVKVSRLKSANSELGYVCFASSKGKNDYFDYMVIFDNDLVIKKVKVLIYRSTYGGEIMSRSWLKQFIGKTNGQEMAMDKDIDGISGATLSAPSITQGIKELSLLIAEIPQQDSMN
ncbi:MAG: Na+-translocating ferredoxin:NAD+ oxidoreductase RnfG subunit [Ancylomarina sp.]|jgi:Na+-translocating ferredoxin:NAD+ oxidoreductase RnfG subunit